MTEHSKIPLPKGQGKSLLERADTAFDLGFKPAPVPQGIAVPAALRRKPGVPAEPVAPQPVPEAPATPVSQAYVPEVPVAPAPTLQPVEQAVEPIETFDGPIHRVDRTLLRQSGLIVPDGPVTALIEEFRIVKRQVLQSARAAQAAGKGARAQRVLICSPLPGEGKSFCAANLALSMAGEKDSEVLLVDADFAKPSLLALFGLKASGPGLMDALANPAIAVERCVIRTDIPGLSILPAGNRTTQDSEFLASSRTGQLLDRLTAGAPNRLVIFDSPPALAASPAAELAKHVQQAVLVVRADETGQSAIEDALTLLSGCQDIKLLLNAAHFSPSGRRFGDYYGYGG